MFLFGKKYETNLYNISQKGEFLNNILLIEIQKENSCKLYLIYFLDINKHLRQVYLQINDSTKQNIIKYNIKREKLLVIIHSCEIKKDAKFYHSNELNYDLYIFKDTKQSEYEIKAEKKKQYYKINEDTKFQNNDYINLPDKYNNIRNKHRI